MIIEERECKCVDVYGRGNASVVVLNDGEKSGRNREVINRKYPKRDITPFVEF